MALKHLPDDLELLDARAECSASSGIRTLKYHLYKSPRRASTKSDALALLPVRLSGTAAKQDARVSPGRA